MHLEANGKQYLDLGHLNDAHFETEKAYRFFYVKKLQKPPVDNAGMVPYYHIPICDKTCGMLVVLKADGNNVEFVSVGNPKLAEDLNKFEQSMLDTKVMLTRDVYEFPAKGYRLVEAVQNDVHKKIYFGLTEVEEKEIRLAQNDAKPDKKNAIDFDKFIEVMRKPEKLDAAPIPANNPANTPAIPVAPQEPVTTVAVEDNHNRLWIFTIFAGVLVLGIWAYRIKKVKKNSYDNEE